MMMMMMMMIFGASGLHQVGQPLPTVEALSFFATNSREFVIAPTVNNEKGMVLRDVKLLRFGVSV